MTNNVTSVNTPHLQKNCTIVRIFLSQKNNVYIFQGFPLSALFYKMNSPSNKGLNLDMNWNMYILFENQYNGVQKYTCFCISNSYCDF